jgi:hypothetical protein
MTENSKLVSADEAVKALEILHDTAHSDTERDGLWEAIRIISTLPAVPQTNEILAHGPICGAENGGHVCSLESGHATEHNCCGVSWPLENPFESVAAVPQEEGPPTLEEKRERTFKEFLELPEGWDSYGAAKISQAAVDKAREILDSDGVYVSWGDEDFLEIEFGAAVPQLEPRLTKEWLDEIIDPAIEEWESNVSLDLGPLIRDAILAAAPLPQRGQE